MLGRLPAVAGAVAAALAIAGCSDPASPPPLPDVVLVVTAGGSALVDGATDVPPTLDLRVVTSGALAQVGARLDGAPLALRRSRAAATASVAPMPLGSAHRLDVDGGSVVESLGFHVVSPAGAAAAVHAPPGGGAVLDVAFERAPDRGAVEQGLHGGVRAWPDPLHLRVTWAAAPGGTLRVSHTVRTDRGSHLVGDLTLSLTATPPGRLRRSAVPEQAASPRAPLAVAFSTNTVASHESIAEHADQLSLLSPTGWTAAGDGSLGGAPDAGSLFAAATGGVPVWPLLQNRDFDGPAVATLLGDQAATSRLIAALRRALSDGGYPGVHLDFEGVPPDHRDAFSSFVKRLAAALHADRRRLAVAVVPHRPGHLTSYSAPYDLRQMAVADLVTLMAYDQHGSAGNPGPVAGLDWDGQVLDGSLPDLHPAATLLGLPLYARAWQGTDSTYADGFAGAVSGALADPGARVDYDFAAATPLIRSGDGTSVTYFDDAPSLALKLALAARRHLTGVAMWRLGFEDPALWSLLPQRARRL